MPGNFTQTVSGVYVPEGAQYSGAVNAAKVQTGARRTRRSRKMTKRSKRRQTKKTRRCY